MLPPDRRQLYVESLQPPVGFELREAVATTYSLDPSLLLGIPVAISLPHVDASKLGKDSAVTLLEALRRVASKLTVFCNAGDIALSVPHVLYGLLESVVVEARGPKGGALHAKLWLLHFEPQPGEEEDPFLRLIVLSRNLTFDRCWDVSLQLDGRITGRNRRENRPLADLLRALPAMAVRGSPPSAAERCQRLADLAWRADWLLPDGFESVDFHVFGTGKNNWALPETERLVVVSPFVRADALEAYADSTREPTALVARAEELVKVPAKVLARFKKVYVLADEATTEDGEDPAAEIGLRGLHAKLLLAERSWYTHLWLGSTNATNAALHQNVELFAELYGKKSRVSGIDALLDGEAFGGLLVEYVPPASPPEVDATQVQAEESLRTATELLSAAPLRVRFEASGGGCVPSIESREPLTLVGIRSARAWLLTTSDSTAGALDPLYQGKSLELPECAIASATGLVAFELEAQAAELRQSFVLNLPTENLPADREAHIFRLVIDNRDRFLAYLMALLEGLDPDAVIGASGDGAGGGGAEIGGILGPGLLERLVRARARAPERLRELKEVIDRLCATDDGRKIVPPEFFEVWDVVSEGM